MEYFPLINTEKDLSDALSESTIPKELLGSDPNNSVTIGIMKSKNAEAPGATKDWHRARRLAQNEQRPAVL